MRCAVGDAAKDGAAERHGQVQHADGRCRVGAAAGSTRLLHISTDTITALIVLFVWLNSSFNVETGRVLSQIDRLGQIEKPRVEFFFVLFFCSLQPSKPTNTHARALLARIQSDYTSHS